MAAPAPKTFMGAMTIERIHHEVVGSTNDLARSLASGGLRRPIAVTAEEQTDGRGREGRRWASPRGGAWISLAWPSVEGADADHPSVTASPLIVGLAVAEAIDEALGGVARTHPASGFTHDPASVRVKWPNDVLLGIAKVAGVLCERQVVAGAGGRSSPLIIGVGINVANATEDLVLHLGEPPRLPTTSLSAFAGFEIEPEAVIGPFLRRAETRLTELATRGFDGGLRSAVESRLAHVGKTVRVGSDAEGVARGIDEEGRLRVRRADGTEQRFVSGEIRLGPPESTQNPG